MIRDMPVDRIGIEDYKYYLSKCRISENDETETPELKDARSRIQMDVFSNSRAKMANQAK